MTAAIGALGAEGKDKDNKGGNDATEGAVSRGRLRVFADGLRYVLDPRNLLRELTDWRPREWVLLVVLVTAQVAAFVLAGDWSATGWIGLATGVFTIFSLTLCNVGRVTNFLWGFLGCSVWMVVSFHNWLIGDFFSNMYYVVMNVIGVYFWTKALKRQGEAGDETSGVHARRLRPWQVAAAAVALVAIYAVVLAVSLKANGNQAWLDATLLPLGIIGQLLMTFGYTAQWAAWIAVDVVNVGLYGNQLAAGGPAALSMLVLQVCMLLNAFYGTYCWVRDERGQQAAARPAADARPAAGAMDGAGSRGGDGDTAADADTREGEHDADRR